MKTNDFDHLNALVTHAISEVMDRLPDAKETIKSIEENGTALAEDLLRTLNRITEKTRDRRLKAERKAAMLASLRTELIHEFTLVDEMLDVVRVKWVGDTPPTYKEAIQTAYTPERPVVRTAEEWNRVGEHLQGLPKNLERNRLITDFHSTLDGFNYLEHGQGGWYCGWCIGDELCERDLILRRHVASPIIQV